MGCAGGSGIWRHALAPLLVSGCVLLTPTAAFARVDDADLVYCFAAPHRAETAAAGVTLGVVRAGAAPDTVRVSSGTADLTLEQWRRKDAPGFDRACAAVAWAVTPDPADPGPADRASNTRSSSSAGWSAFGGVITGALLTGLLTELREARAHRRTQAAALRASVRSFYSVVSVYVRRRLEPPAGRDGAADAADAAAQAARSDLLTQLAHVAVEKRHSAGAERLARALESAPLGPELTTGWQGDRRAKADGIQAALDALVKDVGRLALAVERPHGSRHQQDRTHQAAQTARTPPDVTPRQP